MNQVLHFLREYPFVVGVGLFCAVSALLAVILSVAMHRAGVSLKPLVFVFGFFAIVGGPQAVVHLLDALAHARSKDTAAANFPAAPSASNGPALQPVAWEIVFGPNADPALITDAKRGLEFIVGEATEAKQSFNAAGESALAARFNSPTAANAALRRYVQFFQFANPAGSETAGWTARRYGQGEWNHVVIAGNELYAWSGPSREGVEGNRVRALGAPSADAAGTATVASSKQQVSTRLASNTPVMVVFLVVNLTLAVFWFFKGSAWAARVAPPTGTLACPLEALRSRLLEIPRTDSPMQVTASADGQSLEISWRYADAQWVDHLRAHKLRRAHKLVLAFDDSARKVRVREYWSAFDASAGPDGARLKWQAATGIQFFQFDHQRVFGAQLDARGKPTGELSRAFTFNLQALKAPILQAVTESGWTWQPLVWNAPAPLRWLTE